MVDKKDNRRVLAPLRWVRVWAEGSGELMAITLMCPNLRCRKILVVHNRYRGSRVRCSYCGTNLVVPWPKKTRPGSPGDVTEDAGARQS